LRPGSKGARRRTVLLPYIEPMAK